MQSDCTISVFIFMMCFFEVFYTTEVYGSKVDNIHDLIKSANGKRGDSDNIQDNKKDNLYELLNSMERKDEIELELGILKRLQALSAMENIDRDTERVEDREISKGAMDQLKTINKKHIRGRRRDSKGWFWWGCPECDKSKVHDCECPIPAS